MTIWADFQNRQSGVAWVYSKRPDDLRVIQTWPGGSGVKVPSTIRYHNDGRKFWGFEASLDDPTTLRWFKLLLVDDRDMKQEIKTCPYIKKARSSLEASQKQPQEVVQDYLSLLWGHTIENLCKQQRRVIVDAMPFRVVLTVPATWAKTPNATERLRRAAERAGILDDRPCGETKLHVVAEPEAAAFAIMMEQRGDTELVVRTISLIVHNKGTELTL
jgi:molecular chaperone DnaK (HSP70)